MRSQSLGAGLAGPRRSGRNELHGGHELLNPLCSASQVVCTSHTVSQFPHTGVVQSERSASF